MNEYDKIFSEIRDLERLADDTRGLAKRYDEQAIELRDMLVSTMKADVEATRAEIETLQKQVKDRVDSEVSRSLLFGADRLAGEVDRLITKRIIHARSPAGDALLDYGETRYFGHRPIDSIRGTMRAVEAKLLPTREASALPSIAGA